MVAHKQYHDDVAAERAARPDEFTFAPNIKMSMMVQAYINLI